MKRIEFHTEDIVFSLAKPLAISNWITDVIQREEKKWEQINYIFCSDAYLHTINVQYLQHDTYTDIITFPITKHPIESDIFISIDRVKENAEKYHTSFENELYRVMIHGILHLCGYKDKTENEQRLMTQKEDEALLLWNNKHAKKE